MKVNKISKGKVQIKTLKKQSNKKNVVSCKTLSGRPGTNPWD